MSKRSRDQFNAGSGTLNANTGSGNQYNADVINFSTTQSNVSKEDQCLNYMRREYNPDDLKGKLEAREGGLLPGPCEWILASPEFRRWRDDQENGLLRIQGSPGKGKTMLLCHIITSLRSASPKRQHCHTLPSPARATSAPLVSFAFCQRSYHPYDKASSILISLIYKLVEDRDTLLRHVVDEYDPETDYPFKGSLSLEALKRVLERIFHDEHKAKFCLVVDALDECTTDLEPLLYFIAKTSSFQGVKWLVSSRQMDLIELGLSLDYPMIPLLNLDECQQPMAVAVGMYVEKRVASLCFPQEKREEIRTQLRRKAEDTFLWASIVVKMLRKARSWNAMNILDSLPTKLTELYQELLGDLVQDPNKENELCQRTLATVTSARRPLQLEELFELAGFPDMIETVDQAEEVVAMCGPFLTLQNRQVSFFHLSIKEYLSLDKLESAFKCRLPDMHVVLYSQSLKLMQKTLRRDIFRLGNPGALINDIEGLNPDPLSRLRYSCLYWVKHFEGTRNRSQSDDESVEHFLRYTLLNWLEALSLQRKVPEGAKALRTLNKILVNTKVSGLYEFVEDALRFVLHHRHVIEIAPLQVYVSALIFSPTESLVRKCFQAEEPAWVILKPKMEANWDASVQTIEGHSGDVYSIAFSPDGRRLASASRDRTVKIWDASSFQLIYTIERLSRSIATYSTASGRQLLAVGLKDGGIEIWDMEEWSHTKSLAGHSEAVTHLSCTSNGSLLASGSYDYTIKIWDLSRGAYVRTIPELGSDLSFSFSNDGRLLALCAVSDRLRVWDATTGECIHTLGYHGYSVHSVAFLLNGSLASGGSDGTIKIWDLAQAKCIRTLHVDNDPINNLLPLEKTGQFASQTREGTIKVWDGEGACVHHFKGHCQGPVDTPLVSAPGEKTLASISPEGIIKVWDLTVGYAPTNTGVHDRHIWLIDLSADGKQLAILTGLGTIEIWDTSNGTCVSKIKDLEMKNLPNSLTFFPGGRYLFVSMLPKFGLSTMHVIDTTKGRRIETFRGVEARSFSTDGQSVACSFPKEPKVRIWDSTIRRIVLSIKTSAHYLAFSGSHIVLASYGTIEVWDRRQASCSRKIQRNHGLVNSVALSENSQILVAAMGEAGIYLWSVRTGQLLRKLESEMFAPTMFWSLDGERVALEYGNKAEIWHPAGRCAKKIALPSRGVRTIGFSTRCNNRLCTNVGDLDLDEPSSNDPMQSCVTQEPRYHGYGLSRDGAWVIRGSQGILWLPSEYRRTTRIRESSVAIGRRSAHPLLMRLE